MSNFVSTKRNLRKALLFCFHLKKSAAESQRMLSEAYSNYTPSISIYEYCFDIIKKIILTPWRRRMSKPEKVWRWGTGSFTRSRPELNARRACRITKCWSINDFQTFESYWNDTKERKLGAVQVEAEVCRKAQNDL